MENNLTITEELFLQIIRCSKAAYLMVNEPHLAQAKPIYFDNKEERISKELLDVICSKAAKIDKGSQNLEEMVSNTGHHTSKRNYAIQGAVFRTNDKEVAQIHAIEKREKTTVWYVNCAAPQMSNEDFYRAGYQFYVLKKCGIKVDSFILVYLNPEYINGDKEHSALIKPFNILQKCRLFYYEVERYLAHLLKVLKYSYPPSQEKGYYCQMPNECVFKKYCWKNIPKGNIFELTSMSFPQKFRHFLRGDILQDKLSKYVKLSAHDTIQVEATKSGVAYINREKCLEYKSKSANGYVVLDFLFVRPAIPEFLGSKPFDYLPFHYSLSQNVGGIITKESATINVNGKYDIRNEFISQLVTRLKHLSTKPILVYNSTFIKSRLSEFAGWYPEHSYDITLIRKALVDISKVLTNKYYYHPEFYGRHDLWTVMKVLEPDYEFDSVKVHHRWKAQRTYFLIKGRPEKYVKEQKIILEHYSTFNTKAIHAIVRQLSAIA